MASTKLLVDLEANSAKLVNEIQKANASIKGMHQGITDMKSSLSLISYASIVQLGEKALQAATQIYNFTEGLANAGKEIQKHSQILGMSTTQYQQWIYTAQMSEVSTETLDRGMKFLSRTIGEAQVGTGKGADAFKMMGLSAKDTSGNVKPLDTMMGEVAEKFASWQDGPNKVALALSVFGRSGQELLPILDLGRRGIEELKGEALRLNAVLGKDTVKTLADSEESFKRWSMVWKASKAETFAPLVDILGNVLERIISIKNAWSDTSGFIGGIKAVYSNIVEAQKQAKEEAQANALGPASWVSQWAANYTPPVKKEAPFYNPDNPLNIQGFSIKKINEELDKIREKVQASTYAGAGWGGGEALGLKPGEMRLEGVVTTTKDYEKSQEALNKAIQGYVDLQEAAGPNEIQKALMDKRSLDLTNERQQSILRLTGEYAGLTGNTTLAIQSDKQLEDLYISMNTNLIPAQVEAIKKLGDARRTNMTDSAVFFKDIGTQIATTWSNSMGQVLTGQKTFAQGMKETFASLAEYIISYLLKMAAMEALFGNQKGAGGLGNATSWIGSAISIIGLLAEGGVTPNLLAHYPIHSFAGGGVATSPQLGIFGEGGGQGEAFVPLGSGGKIPVDFGDDNRGGGNTYIVNQITATDVKSFEDQLNRNPAAVINILYKNARKGGAMKDIIRSVQ